MVGDLELILEVAMMVASGRISILGIRDLAELNS